MMNKLIYMWLFIFVLTASLGQASIEELNAYFEIRDTINLMNDEMKKGLEHEEELSLFDEDQIEFKLESFIRFMENRVSMYGASDSKLKFHYVKKLNSLLDVTYKLFAKAKPLIKAKLEAKQNKKDYTPKITYSTIVHPYFDSIDFRTLASREPLNGDFTLIHPAGSVEIDKSNKKVISSLPKKETSSKVQKEVPKEDVVKTPEKPVVKDNKESEDANKNKVEVVTKIDNKKKKETIEEKKSVETDFMRPMAIMIENHNQARPQSGLLDATMIYEIPVEGGITRFMALFTKMPGLVGPVRSCREYFVDRALEVDALYVHCGGSPMGYAYLSKTKIRSIDEIKNSPPFFRDKIRKAPHNLYGKGELIYKYMSKRTDMRVKKQTPPLNYGTRTELGKESGNYIKINYHGNYNVVIKEENGVYHRYMNNILHLDRESKKPLEANTVILQVASMKIVDVIGRQEISFIGTGTAYIFEKGKRTPVTWHKVAPRSKTVYTDSEGKEYLFSNSGQVWVQVVSPKHKVFFEPVKENPKVVEKAKTKTPTEAKTKTETEIKAKTETETKAKDKNEKKEKAVKKKTKVAKKDKS